MVMREQWDALAGEAARYVLPCLGRAALPAGRRQHKKAMVCCPHLTSDNVPVRSLLQTCGRASRTLAVGVGRRGGHEARAPGCSGRLGPVGRRATGSTHARVSTGRPRGASRNRRAMHRPSRGARRPASAASAPPGVACCLCPRRNCQCRFRCYPAIRSTPPGCLPPV